MLRSYLFVERALSRERVTIPCVRGGIGEDRLAERAPCSREVLEHAERREREQRGAATRRLRLRRPVERMTERVRDHASPGGRAAESAAGREDGVLRLGRGRQQLVDECEPERDGLERGLHHLQWRDVQREAGDHRALATTPAGRALTGQERQDREAGSV